MKKYVKNTTVEWFLDLLFPCYCRGCGKIGAGLCERCYFYNRKKNPAFASNVDKEFKQIFACGMREGLLSEMVMEYKFYSRRYYAGVFARLMTEVIMELSEAGAEEYVIVPLPTISRHIRERGFDHIGFLCDKMAAKYGFKVERLLERANSAVQVGSSAEQRLEQARRAYRIASGVHLDEKSHYLLVDDVWTTGASMRAARAVLVEEIMRKAEVMGKRRAMKKEERVEKERSVRAMGGEKDTGNEKSNIKISAIVIAKNDGYEFK